jgi:multidrug efflux pump
VLDKIFGGWLFRPFNRFFDRASHGYVGTVRRVIRSSGIALLLYAGLMVLTFFGFANTPTGFVPGQDKQYLVAFAQLPDASSLDRTEDVIKRMSDLALKQPGVESAVAFPGLSINGFTNSPNAGIVFVTLKPFDERKDPSMSAGAIAGALNGQYAGFRKPTWRSSHRRRYKAWAPLVVSVCKSKTGATWVTTSCTKKP